MGAGRKQKEDIIDNAVGITLVKKISDEVKKGDILAYVHASTPEKATEAVENMQKAYKFTSKKVKKPNTILEVV